MEPKQRSLLGTLFTPAMATLTALAFCAAIAAGGFLGHWSNVTALGSTTASEVAEVSLAGALGFGAAAVGLGVVMGAAGGTVLERRRAAARLAQRDRQLQSLQEELTASQHWALDATTWQQQFTSAQEQAASEASRTAELRQRLAERDRQLSELKAQQERDLQDIQANVEQTWDANAVLTNENHDLSDYIASLEAEIETLQSNLAEAWRYQDTSPSADLESPDLESRQAEAPDFATVSVALAAAEEDFGDVLEVWESAKAAAAESLFGRPGEVYRALAAIAEVGRHYFAAAEQGVGMGDWRSHFKRYGLEFKPTEHQVTRTMYGTERIFRHQGRKQQMLKHLTLGRNNVVHTLQIYFEIDRPNAKVTIGYCGKHLPCYRWAS